MAMKVKQDNKMGIEWVIGILMGDNYIIYLNTNNLYNKTLIFANSFQLEYLSFFGQVQYFHKDL